MTHLDYCLANHDWLLEFIEALVAIESPSDDPAAVNRCGHELASRLESMGAAITRIPSSAAGDHLRAGFGSGPRQILLLGHFDTVWPVGQLATMPLKRDAGRLHGPGVFDMKAGIGLASLATRAVIEQGLDGCQIVMLWTTDEEVGSTTSRALIEAEAIEERGGAGVRALAARRRAQDQPQGRGAVRADRARGVGTRRPRSGKGVSAVRELARQIIAIDDLQDPAHGVTVTVGVIRGGTRANVVPDEARATIDARANTRADAERIARVLKSLQPQIAGARLEVKGGFDRPPLERSAAVVRLFEIAQGGGRRHRPHARRGQRRRRLRRQLHRRHRGAHARRHRRHRRRRARAARARRDRRPGAAGGCYCGSVVAAC